MDKRLEFVAPLFVPGHRPDRFDKAAASEADAIILDLEDAVPFDMKRVARRELRATFTEKPVLVRINAFGTHWHTEDLAAVLALPITAILLPKAEFGADLLGLAEAASASGMTIVALIETARGLAGARDIIAVPNVGRLAFGSIDYCADLGSAHTREALLFARSELVLATRLAAKTPPIDGVTVRIDDDDAVGGDARHARDLGFGGKLAIHPRQIGAIRRGFQPDNAEIEWARKVIGTGDGAVAIDGVMVDEPVRLRAQSVLRRVGQL